MHPEEKQETIKPFMIHLQHFFNDNERVVSFPIWFDDSMIKKQGIQKITRRIYSSSDDLSIDSISPKEIIEYEFDEKGQLITIHVNHYYENVNMGSASFHYTGEKDEHGYCMVTKGKNLNDYDDISQNYTVFDKEKYTDKYLVYRDEQSGDYSFFMLNHANWGALSVDSILHPTAQDLIVLGTPRNPTKKYRVKNRVNESDVVEFSYHSAVNAVNAIDYDKYPFHYRRTFRYAIDGVCSGFIDSTFSNNEYLTRRITSFEVNAGLLEIVKHSNSVGTDDQGSYQVEHFSYTYFEAL